MKYHLKEIVFDMVDIYLGKRVSRSAAAMAYFFTLSIFPMLICVYAMLGNFLPSADTVIEFAEGLIPAETMSTLLDYFDYIRVNKSPAMLMAGLAVMATSSAAAIRTLNSIMGDIQGKSRFQGIFAVAFSFILSLILLAVIYFAVIVIITGNWFISFLDEKVITFASLSSTWNWLRFLMLFAMLLVIIYGVYVMTMPKGARKSLMPGAVFASVLLVLVSMVFSWFIGLSSKYPLVYGSLASVIILMFWLYICGNILIMGNVFNVVLRKYDPAGTETPEEIAAHEKKKRHRIEYHTSPNQKK